MKKTINSYDEIKGMLNKVRKLSIPKNIQNIREQEEKENILVINGIDVEIHSEDQMDLELNDDEKGKISQLIDDFRDEISEVADFEKLDIYPNSSKLSGKINGVDLSFTFSTGDDIGIYITTSLLKIDENVSGILELLKKFQDKFSSTLNDIISLRKDN